MHTFPALISALAVIQFMTLIFMVGRARGKYGVMPPATSGPVEFERAYRVQQNTLEQLVAFLPSLWLFSYFLQAPQMAAVLGGIWLVGRVLYARAYARGQNRFPGFFATLIPTTILILGALVGILRDLAA